jgi:ribosome maturation factor RimP
MDKQQFISSLRQIIEDYLKHEGVEMADLVYHYEGRDLYLRILADKPDGGITLEECAHLNTQIGRILDENDILEQRYILEVSSPGLDRPLVTRSDFLRCLTRRVRFFLREKINGKTELEGIIKNVGDESVDVQLDAQIITIPLAQIAKAKQIIGNS